MTNWKLTIAYLGTGFHGWQIQPDLVTVQGTLAAALHRLTGEQVLPQGAGRTDTGVHARGQVASFQLAAPLPAENLQRALNRVLPAGIRVLSADIMPPSFHARHSSRGKLYEYRVFERRQHADPDVPAKERICSPFLAPFVWDCRWPLALERMQAAAQHLIGTHDFTAMAATSRPSATDADQEQHNPDSHKPASQPNPIKTMHEATWAREDDLLIFRIRGSGFLHHMVRNLVGTMVDVGRGSLAPSDIPRILASRDRSEAGPTAPAQGLYLVEVHYPAHDEHANIAQPAAVEVSA